ncbi:Ig-like domain-containing protein, partial [Myxococcota bacterium]|nr:Ig-like domain-containing protein [Myxococcota bacterium]
MHRAPLTPRVFALTLALSACDSATTALRDAGTEPPAPVLVSIDVTAAARMIAKGETLALVATGRWDDGTTRALTEGVAWSSSNALVATVDATGVVTAIDVGESVLTAAVDDVRGTLTLTVVRSALTTLALEPATVTVDRGATTTLVARGTFEDGTTRDVSSAVEWSSSATEIATVTEGVVTGLTTGDAIISVRDAASGISSDSRSATVTVVEPRPTSVRVDPVGVTLPVGETQPFTATAVYADGST